VTSKAPVGASRTNAAQAPTTPPALTVQPVATARPPTQASLAAELASIEAVRGALAAKDGNRALRALSEYERAYGGGTFALEAQVLRIEAFALLGDRAELKRLAEAFLAAHPNSPYARRVRSLLSP
jgi:hypothetical protein